MRRLLGAVLLIGIVFVLGKMVVSEIQTFVNDASVIVSSTERARIEAEVRRYVNTEILNADNQLDDTDEIIISTTHINTNGQKDVIARIESEKTCGTGGCITVILLKTDTDEYKPIPFTYVVKSIEAEHSISNGMHDLKINDDTNNLMSWDGERYVLNTQ